MSNLKALVPELYKIKRDQYIINLRMAAIAASDKLDDKNKLEDKPNVISDKIKEQEKNIDHIFKKYSPRVDTNYGGSIITAINSILENKEGKSEQEQVAAAEQAIKDWEQKLKDPEQNDLKSLERDASKLLFRYRKSIIGSKRDSKPQPARNLTFHTARMLETVNLIKILSDEEFNNLQKLSEKSKILNSRLQAFKKGMPNLIAAAETLMKKFENDVAQKQNEYDQLTEEQNNTTHAREIQRLTSEIEQLETEYREAKEQADDLLSWATQKESDEVYRLDADIYQLEKVIKRIKDFKDLKKDLKAAVSESDENMIRMLEDMKLESMTLEQELQDNKLLPDNLNVLNMTLGDLDELLLMAEKDLKDAKGYVMPEVEFEEAKRVFEEESCGYQILQMQMQTAKIALDNKKIARNNKEQELECYKLSRDIKRGDPDKEKYILKEKQAKDKHHEMELSQSEIGKIGSFIKQTPGPNLSTILQSQQDCLSEIDQIAKKLSLSETSKDISVQLDALFEANKFIARCFLWCDPNLFSDESTKKEAREFSATLQGKDSELRTQGRHSRQRSKANQGDGSSRSPSPVSARSSSTRDSSPERSLTGVPGLFRAASETVLGGTSGNNSQGHSPKDSLSARRHSHSLNGQSR